MSFRFERSLHVEFEAAVERGDEAPDLSRPATPPRPANRKAAEQIVSADRSQQAAQVIERVARDDRRILAALARSDGQANGKNGGEIDGKSVERTAETSLDSSTPEEPSDDREAVGNAILAAFQNRPRRLDQLVKAAGVRESLVEDVLDAMLDCGDVIALGKGGWFRHRDDPKVRDRQRERPPTVPAASPAPVIGPPPRAIIGSPTAVVPAMEVTVTIQQTYTGRLIDLMLLGDRVSVEFDQGAGPKSLYVPARDVQSIVIRRL